MSKGSLSHTICYNGGKAEREVRLTLNHLRRFAQIETTLRTDDGIKFERTTACSFDELAIALANAIPCGVDERECFVHFPERASLRPRKRTSAKEPDEWRIFPREWIRRAEDALGVYLEGATANAA